MKIEIETIFLIIFVIILPIMVFYFISSSSDNYLSYVTGREIIRNPMKLIDGEGFMICLRQEHLETHPFFYPPLGHIIYGIIVSIGLPPDIIDAALIIIIGYLLWKIDKKSLPLTFLSFMFIRLLIFGSNDVILVALTLSCIYFFDKKPILSGIFAGLCPLIKGTGFFVLGCYGLSVLLFKRKNIINKQFYKKAYFLSIIIAILILSPWYIRNYFVFEGDLLATITGQTLERIRSGEKFLEAGLQAEQPERSFIDTSGFYPLPIDLLLVFGSLFTVYNLFKDKKVSITSLFILVYLFVFCAVQIFQIDWLMSWRYYIPIFPLLAVEISKRVPIRKIVYGICFILLIVWVFTFPLHSYSTSRVGAIEDLCMYVNHRVNNEPIYLKSPFDDWLMIYKCDFNATSLNQSKWYVNVTTVRGVGERTMFVDIYKTEEVV